MFWSFFCDFVLCKNVSNRAMFSSSCTRWLSGFLNFVCMLPLLHNTFGYLSLAVLRSCYSADVHAPCSHSLTLLPCSSGGTFAKQRLVLMCHQYQWQYQLQHQSITLLLSLLVSRSMHHFDSQMKLLCLDSVPFHILHMDGYFVAIVWMQGSLDVTYASYLTHGHLLDDLRDECSVCQKHYADNEALA